jgi:mono/diheme cytochrome c family protein
VTAALIVVPLLGLAVPAGADPALDYMLNCQGCHRADGAGTPGGVPALAGHVARFLSVAGGREYLVRVPGVSQSVLDDERLAALLDWLLARFDAPHLPADFRTYAPAEVAALRRHPLTDVERTREQLLGGANRADALAAAP